MQIVGLTKETRDSITKKLTKAGKWSIFFTSCLAILTLLASVIENYADGKLNKEATEKGNAQFVNTLQKNNDLLLAPLTDSLTRLKNSAEHTQTEVMKTTSDLNSLDHSLKSLVPLNLLDFTAQLSDWVEIPSSSPGPNSSSTVRQGKLQSPKHVKIRSEEWNHFICDASGKPAWVLRINVTSNSMLLLKSPGSYVKMQGTSDDGVCRLGIYGKTGGKLVGFEQSNTSTANIGENENTVFIKHILRRLDFSEGFQKDFNISALNSPEQQSIIVRVHSQLNSRYSILLPLHISAQIHAVAVGSDQIITRSWELNLTQQPLANMSDSQWYAYYAVGKTKRQPTLYVNE